VQEKLMNKYIISLLIVIIAGLTYIPYLGSMPLFDWDELNFAESAREMIVSGNYSRVMVNFQPFWEKPPLFFWIQTISMKTFGINEFGARFPNVIAGILTFLVIFHIGRRYYDTAFGVLWALSFFGAFLPHLYFKTGIIDPYFNLFIFLGVFFLFRAIHPSEEKQEIINSSPEFENKYRLKQFLIAGLFIGIAILTKGPVALLISILCLCVYFVLNRFKKFIKIKELFLFFLVAGLISLFWFGAETIKNGIWFIQRFILYQLELAGTSQAGHGQPFYYHFVVLLIGCFPVSILALFSIKSISNETNLQKNLRTWMLILFWVVLILFSLVTTKILHYSSLCYLPMTFLSAYTLRAMMDNRLTSESFMRKSLLFMGFLFSIAFIALPFIGRKLPELTESTKFQFVKEAVKANVNWDFTGSGIGIIYLIILITTMIFWNKGKIWSGAISLLIGTAIVFELLLFYIIPKVDAYTQATAVEFYKSKRGKNVYLEVIGFKSFGYLFYSDKQMNHREESFDKSWLLFGKIDKPVYFVTKVGTDEMHKLSPGIKELYRKNGYIFLKRLPEKK
jgi:4-amino-4-deoxy-L-arabinose transferase-like glycosyltransferase